ncbi:MAG: carbon storage regulator CsrA [Thermodesulfovibrionales bacterium]
MLVLTRKSDEGVRIGDDIRITVVEIKGNQVRLGIEAPQTVPIYRNEVYEKVRKENRLSSGATLEAFGKLKEVVTRHANKL